MSFSSAYDNALAYVEKKKAEAAASEAAASNAQQWSNTTSNLANQAQYGGVLGSPFDTGYTGDYVGADHSSRTGGTDRERKNNLYTTDIPSFAGGGAATDPGYMGMLDRIASGYGSAAEARMRASGQMAAQNARSIASSSYGVNPVTAGRMATNQGNQAVLQANQQAGIVAAQQAQQARAQLAQLMQYYTQLGMSADEAAMAAAMQWEASQTQLGQSNASAAAAAEAKDTGLLGPAAQMAGTLIGYGVGGPGGAMVGGAAGNFVGQAANNTRR